ncbi:short chain dehydrogenase (AtsC) [Sporothrix schenckii 1099-18]|uniref:NAD(P)-binding protein n=2 Tax=Sporothrix schenckii TaxID=29908 RepID=U7PRY9_SPOS1|nr:short chain dehydrogenase (AtsC) [Sporothrix schenckii 1099-18]ERS98378.1 hypothetical protein HMPREF1624_05162 [Sporothrix schenckii ATCC 58251]KJR89489.1 short chain dehydrogenase (AtsC) [Sporothrix schenckii 1099-18]
MPSYVVVGASRGIGFGLVKELAADKNNTVVGLVRNVEASKAKFAAEIPGANIHTVYADLANRKSLETAAAETAAITGGAVDVFIANAAIGIPVNRFLTDEVTSDPELFEKNMDLTFRINVVGTIESVAFFAPLVEKSKLKKIVVISSGAGDIDFILQSGMDMQSPYAISKAALNMAVAKFHLEYKPKGVLVFAISPGLVDTEFATDPNNPLTEADAANKNEAMARIVGLFKAYAPHWEPVMLTPTQSAQAVIKVIGDATIAKDGGKMVSHHGTQRWL